MKVIAPLVTDTIVSRGTPDLICFHFIKVFTKLLILFSTMPVFIFLKDLFCNRKVLHYLPSSQLLGSVTLAASSIALCLFKPWFSKSGLRILLAHSWCSPSPTSCRTASACGFTNTAFVKATSNLPRVQLSYRFPVCISIDHLLQSSGRFNNRTGLQFSKIDQCVHFSKSGSQFSKIGPLTLWSKGWLCLHKRFQKFMENKYHDEYYTWTLKNIHQNKCFLQISVFHQLSGVPF